MELHDIRKFKNHPDNPRKISNSQLEKLMESIKKFPEMLKNKPIMAYPDEEGNYIVFAGNMRLKALKKLKYKEIPAVIVTDYTEDQIKNYIIEDNKSYGQWDFEMLGNDIWNNYNVGSWNNKDSHPDPEFKKKFDSHNDQTAELPITPSFHEKHSLFVIYVDNEIDEAWIRNNFKLTEKHTTHKSTDHRLSNVIPFETFQKAWQKLK